MANADQRRAPRLATSCRVEIDDRFGAWSAVTEDVGVRGCRLVTRRAPKLGALLRLTLRFDRLEAPLQVAGQAVWARDGRVGISFVGPLAGGITPAAWLRDLAAALEAPASGASPLAAAPAPGRRGAIALEEGAAAAPRARAGGTGR